MNSSSPNRSPALTLTGKRAALALIQASLAMLAVGWTILAGGAWPRWAPLIGVALCGIVRGWVPVDRRGGSRLLLSSAIGVGIGAWIWRLRSAPPLTLAVDGGAWAAALLALALGFVETRRASASGWRAGLAVACGVGIGGALWTAGGYVQNRPSIFYLGLAAGVGSLIALRLQLRPRPWATHAVHSPILLLLCLPVADRCLPRAEVAPRRAAPGTSAVRSGGFVLSGFARWWNRYLEEWERMGRAIFVGDPERVYPFRLRPNSVGRLFESQIRINSLGLRGGELASPKGRRYRILALGESTTFGCTMRTADRTWPQLLKAMIVDRLHPRLPIEVINAGTPSYHLGHNLRRVARELLRLEPDLIVSYHGFNGFGLLGPRFEGALLPAAAPRFEPRPLRLLANCDYRLRLALYRRWEDRLLAQAPPLSIPLLETGYGRAYRGLAELARTNGIGLVLCTFSMAVDAASKVSEVNFYREIFPLVKWQVQANDLHSRMVRELTDRNPEVGLVDTRPGLDGHRRFFIDLVHLTQEGRRRLAESIYAGITNRLLAEPGLIASADGVSPP